VIETALIPFLRNTEAVTALVGTRIHKGRRPQGGTLPAIVVHRIDTTRHGTLHGRIPLVNPRIQIDCLALTPDEAMLVADRVRRADGGLSGGDVLGDFRGTMGTYTITSSKITDERDGEPVEPAHDDDRGIHTVSLDWVPWFNEVLTAP
jgi:hypothetical protein